MASDESMTVVSSMVEDDYDDIDVGFEHQAHTYNLSRLSMCTKLLQLSSDSDKEPSCYSLPATPPRRRNRKAVLSQELMGVAKDYASENEAQKGGLRRSKGNNKLSKRRITRDRWEDNESKSCNKKKDGELIASYSNHSGSFSGESEGGSAGLVVITRPKGGQRSLCMDLEEVKACRDLGLELEHERMLEMPSSGGNSPIANWRISSPGDDPRDVKARLKVWAQAVALASTSKHCS
ncbi:hypothetical protein GOBAR_DD11381 [Gossypium barbadense]|nr:hypothetical protein GOBAR_DD11381 [Gossypium barbadense]